MLDRRDKNKKWAIDISAFSLNDGTNSKVNDMEVNAVELRREKISSFHEVLGPILTGPFFAVFIGILNLFYI